MPTTSTLALFLLTALPVCLTPGPGMLFVLSHAALGRREGIASALGLSTATLLHVAALALGLSAALSAVPAAFDALRLSGAAYLVYSGVRLWRAPGAHVEARAPGAGGTRRVYARAALTGALNPKVALFLLAFVPQFVDPRRGSPALQTIAFGALFESVGCAVHLGIALAAHRVARAGRRAPGGARAVRRVAALALIGLGVRLALPARA